MKPIAFPEQTKVLTAPKGYEDEVVPLPVFADGQYVISCWRFSWREWLQLLIGRPLWLLIWGDGTQAPVCLMVEKTPFGGRAAVGEEE